MNLNENVNNSSIEDIENEIVHYSLETFDLIYLATINPILIGFYCFILYIIIKNPKDFNNPYFQLIKALAFADFIQIIYGVMFGVLATFIYVDHTIGILIDLLPLTIGWYGSFFLNIFIAINRFFAIVFYSKYKQIMTKKLHTIFICVSELMGFLTFGPYYIACIIFQRQTNQMIRFSIFTTGLDGCPNLLESYAYMDYVVSLGSVSFIFLLYFLSAIAMLIKKKDSKLKNSSSFAREAKLTLQGLLLFFIIGFVLLFDYVISADYYILVWLYCTINPVLYILCDNVIRKHVVRILMRKQSINIVSVTVTENFRP